MSNAGAALAAHQRAGAVDLNKHMHEKASREADRAGREQVAQKAAIEQVSRWDRAMNRAFKGIVSRPQRHRLMFQAADRAERDAA